MRKTGCRGISNARRGGPAARGLAVSAALACLLSLRGLAVPPSKRPAALPADLDDRVARVMKAFDVPGLALAVVKDGAVLVAKGYGVRTLGRPEPVDSGTLFGIASNTKVFTATALALLVEEGKLEWDAPVVRYLPSFQMWDPWVTREITVRDLLVHRSGLGLGAGDLLWWPPSTYSRKEVTRRLRFLRPETSFRTAYAYDNVLYVVAGELIEAVSGQSWEEFVTRRILRPAGMTASTVNHSSAAAGGNVATPHARVEGSVRPVKPFTSDVTNPAGGINSSAEEMARWLQVLLSRGKTPEGSRLFSEATWTELTSLVTPIRISEPPAPLAALRLQFLGYGLGLVMRDYRGRKVLAHDGGLPGYVSGVLMIPEVGLGVAVLTNQESADACNAILCHIIDHVLQAPRTDWLDAFKRVRAEANARVAGEAAGAASKRVTGSKPHLPLASYAGAYRDDWYGEIPISLEDGRLVLRFSQTPSLVGDLEHWQYETFVVRWRDRELRADAFVTFTLEPDGQVVEARMKAVSSETDFSFDFHHLCLRRLPAPAPPVP